VVWLGWCGIRMQAEALLANYLLSYFMGCIAGFSLHPDATPPQSNHNVTPTRIEPEQ